MPSIKDISPEILISRHRLSVQQVNSIYNKSLVKESIENKVKNLQVVNEFLRIADALKNERIDFIPLKGPLLSFRLYNDPTYRSFNDLDLLVSPEDITRAISKLNQLGYKSESGEWPGKPHSQNNIIRHSNEYPFIKTDTGQLVELHWNLLPNLVVDQPTLKQLIVTNITEINFAGRTFKVFADELELLFLVMHGGSHWWRRLKWLIDISVSIKNRDLNWGKYHELESALKAHRMTALCNSMLTEYFPECPLIPGSISANKFLVGFSKKRILSQKETDEDFYQRIVKSVYYSLISYPGLQHKIRTIRSYLFVKEYYKENRLFSFLPLFYIYGPFKLFLKRLEG